LVIPQSGGIPQSAIEEFASRISQFAIPLRARYNLAQEFARSFPQRLADGSAMDSYLNAEISASAVRHNLALLRGLLKPNAKLCAVVKADCYGHGLHLLAGVIETHCDFFAVATPEEAVRLRELGVVKPVLVFLSPSALGDYNAIHEAMEELIARDVTLTVVSRDELPLLAEAAGHVGRTANVHFKIDTGMGRSGMPPWHVGLLAAALREQAPVRLTGMYTHLASADETDKSYAQHQLTQFRQAMASGKGLDCVVRHAANSAAVIDLPEAHFDMVRPGIAMYGYQPSDQMHRRLALRPAMRLAGRLMQVKTLPAGSRCGYGLTHRFERDSVVGLAPIGYGDGYFRCLSNKASMRVAGRDVPICGRVSMDQIIVDLTDVPGAKVGDEVEIISNDPAAANSIENLARLADTIPYEITCRLGRRVKRVLVE
jgi:alanine racemase